MARRAIGGVGRAVKAPAGALDRACIGEFAAIGSGMFYAMMLDTGTRA